MLAMLLGLVIVPVVSLLTKKTLPEQIDEKFAGYGKRVTVMVKEALPETDDAEA